MEYEKEQNVEVTGVTNFFLKRRLQNVLSTVTYSLSHRQAGASVKNLQATLRISLDLCKNVSLALLFVATIIHVQSLRSQVCVCVCMYVCVCVCVYIYIYIFHNIEAGRTKDIKKTARTAVNITCQGNFSACHFGHACHRFLSTGLGIQSNPLPSGFPTKPSTHFSLKPASCPAYPFS